MKKLIYILIAIITICNSNILSQVVVTQDTVRCSCATPTLSGAGTYTFWNKHNYVVCINLFEWSLGPGDSGFSIGNATHYVQLNPNMTYTDVLRFNDYPYLAQLPYGWKRNKMYVKYYQQNCSTYVGQIEIKLKGCYANNTANCSCIINDIIKEAGTVPLDFCLHNNYPNPFNPTTNIKFDLPKTSNVKIKIFDLLGKEIETLADEKLEAGIFIVNWDASQYASGLYFYQMITNDYVETKKMLLIK